MPSIFAKVFALYQNAQHGCLDVNRFLQALTDVGLLTDDPRLKSMQRKLKHIQVKADHIFLRDFRTNICITSLKQRSTKLKLEDGYGIDFEKFTDMIHEVKPLIKKAFTSDFVIPDFKSFCATITEVSCKKFYTRPINQPI